MVKTETNEGKGATGTRRADSPLQIMRQEHVLLHESEDYLFQGHMKHEPTTIGPETMLETTEMKINSIDQKVHCLAQKSF